MLIFDQLKRSDPQLRVVTLAVLGGLSVLLAGLWWVQVVSARDYQESLETQSFRTVRIPAVRGKILDCNGIVLAENRPTYNVSLYLEELSRTFEKAGNKEIARKRVELKQQLAEQEKRLHRRLTRQEAKQFALSTAEKGLLRQQARYDVASNVVAQVSERIHQPVALDQAKFERHYETRLALPFPIVPNVDPTNIARFEEQSTSPLGVDVEVQSTRVYPHGTSAAHLLGYLRRDDSSAEGEDAFFSYRLPDYRGDLGIEYGFDKDLRGTAGAKSVLVNNLGYRQTENVWTAAEPGRNVVLTIDLRVQRAAEQALANAPFSGYAPVRGAVVVMDVHSGDILALASSPTLNPNYYIQGWPLAEWQRATNGFAQKDRATQERYAPGSVFKVVVGLAMLEAGFDPNTTCRVPPNPADPAHGYILVDGHKFKDTAPPGEYDFRRALVRSSNTYFITNGIQLGPERIVRLGQRFHLGERIGLPLHQETGGSFPNHIAPGWGRIATGNLSIGQAPVTVTPLQIAVLISAVANGGKVLFPRLVNRVESPEPTSTEPPMVFAGGRVWDELGVSQRSLELVHRAMLAETEDPEGTGKHVRDHDPLPGLRICGKTGTAQVQDVNNIKTHQITWFASFAPYGSPRYAVVVMVEDGKSGGDTCSPVAGRIYAALLEKERAGQKDSVVRVE
jgi:penicillin-binding protein 2